MIVTCASCLTKFNLDESRIPAKGTKVRCSRCQHVFLVTPPQETKEEVLESFESFVKHHKELIVGSEQKGVEEKPFPPGGDEREKASEEEEKSFLFSDKISPEQEEEAFPVKPEGEAGGEGKVSKPTKMIHEEKRRRPSLLFIILVILILLLFGLFYLWMELGARGRHDSFLVNPLQKITSLWGKIWGTEREGLIVLGLNRYDEKIGGLPLFVIEGKVDNQSGFTKKYIKIRIVIFGHDKAKLAEKEAVCGQIIGREELKDLPEAFFKGEMVIRPKTEEDRIASPGKTVPFMAIFRNLSAQAEEFQVEIVEAPNL
jgi:predicted Zn finger-like uncharacterized protein